MSIGIRTIYRKLADSVIASNNTLADIGLSVPVKSGQILKGYFEIYLSGTAGGAQVAIVPSAAITSIAARLFLDDPGGGVYVSDSLTALPAGISVAPLNTAAYCTGSFLIQAAADGTIDIQGAQNLADPAATTFFAGSWIEVTLF